MSTIEQKGSGGVSTVVGAPPVLKHCTALHQFSITEQQCASVNVIAHQNTGNTAHSTCNTSSPVVREGTDAVYHHLDGGGGHNLLERLHHGLLLGEEGGVRLAELQRYQTVLVTAAGETAVTDRLGEGGQ